MPRSGSAPGRSTVGRPGAFLLPLLCLLALAGCREQRSAAAARHRLPLGRDTIDLGAGVTVHEVRLGGEPAGPGIHPDSVSARTGDVLRFVAADARGYAIAFGDSTLPAPARDFLERTRQLRGPPLITTGASWVVTLKDAPAGRYPFRSLTRAAGGVLVVQPGPGK